VASVPGVGEAYSDHNLLVYAYHSDLSLSDTLDPLSTGRVNPADLLATNDPILGWNAQDVTCKLRPSSADIASMSASFQDAWKRDFAPHPSRPLMLASLVGGFPADPSLLPPEPAQYFAITTFTAYPYSSGHIHITQPSSSGGNDSLTSGIDFDPGFFSHPLDVEKHMWMYKTQRSIARRMPCYRGEFAALHPPFPPSSPAFCTQRPLAVPPDPDALDIEYTVEDEEILEKWLRANVSTTWHSLGTCAMKAREEGGVVDQKLGVYGVKGLKIADLSVAPRNVAANAAATAMMVGERAADLFLAELGLLKGE
jgi:alcohol oxidase